MKKHGIPYVILAIIAFSFQNCQPTTVHENDWPKFRKDNRLTASTPAIIDVERLTFQWAYTSTQEPQPAWYGPAREDASHMTNPLPSLRDYDKVFYPIVVGNYLYYGSNADDAVYCLDTRNGKVKWKFITGGPVRIAPTFYKGNIYFGSDDGFGYCIHAGNGKLKWKFSPKGQNKQLVYNNGRFISHFPVRTGIMIENGKAYFGASLLPWKKSFFCAVDASTGKPEGEGAYVKEIEEMTFEGSMASTGSKIVQPQGRVPPMIFDKKTGTPLGRVAGTGGCFILITPEGRIVKQEKPFYNSIFETSLEKDDKTKPKANVQSYRAEDLHPGFIQYNKPNSKLMSFKGGTSMLIQGDTIYVMMDNAVVALRRSNNSLIWENKNLNPRHFILSRDAVFVGGIDTVYALSPENGLPLWQHEVDGNAGALIIARGKLFVSTEKGKIYCFAKGSAKSTFYASNLAKKPVKKDSLTPYSNKFTDYELPKPNYNLLGGAFIMPVGRDAQKITYFTTTAVPTHVKYGHSLAEQSYFDKTPKTKHVVMLEGLRKNTKYYYEIFFNGQPTVNYEFDNFFRYNLPPLGKKRDSTKMTCDDVARILEISGLNKGLCIIPGMQDINIATDITGNSEIQVAGFSDNPGLVKKLRKKLHATGSYGKRISIYMVNDLKKLPIMSSMANLVIISDKPGYPIDGVIQLLAPGGMAFIASDDEEVFPDGFDLMTGIVQIEPIIIEGEKRWLGLSKKATSNGEWSHQYANPGNSSFSGTSFGKNTKTDDFEVQWMGRPGPRFPADRGGRKPAPLAVNGKIFVQGYERVIAIDAYNGTVLWFLHMPGLLRMNVHRDCGNQAADKEHVYFAVHGNCIKINGQNGDIEKVIPVIPYADYDTCHWGYIACKGDLLFGSAVKAGANYIDSYSYDGWYDAYEGEFTRKVVSKNIFALNKQTGKEAWVYSAKAIINSTITISEGRVFFIESRNPKLQLSKEGRGGDDLYQNMYLVCLDINTGKTIYERTVKTRLGTTAFYMSCGEGKIVLNASSDNMYDLQCFEALTGNVLWKNVVPWYRNHHGGHLAFPAIASGRLIIKPNILDINTGELLEEKIPRAFHSCASYVLSENSIFYRALRLTQYNFETKEVSAWNRLRPDCWISSIPAFGMVLSPESGAGCTCGIWLETSVVFAPKKK